MSTTTYAVDGMTCEHCVRAVSNELGLLPEVNQVDVDLGTGAVTVTSATALDHGAVEAAIDRAGYTLTR